MIVAHHLGEHLLPTLVAGAATVPILLVALRARFSLLTRALPRRRLRGRRQRRRLERLLEARR